MQTFKRRKTFRLDFDTSTDFSERSNVRAIRKTAFNTNYEAEMSVYCL